MLLHSSEQCLQPSALISCVYQEGVAPSGGSVPLGPTEDLRGVSLSAGLPYRLPAFIF